MHNNINTLFEYLWQNYLRVTPTATKIHKLLGSTQNNDIINDHIALRTFNLEKVSLEKLAKHFTSLGYEECEEYNFEDKKIHAKHYEHTNSNYPKVFISELQVEKFSPVIQEVIHFLVSQVDEDMILNDDFLYSGRHWNIDYRIYKILLEESEYAAWLAAWGYRANHFTVSINHLEKFNTIKEVNQKLKEAGFILNSSGGEIKGSKELLLEQSSTVADKYPVKFNDWEKELPSCFYEFALRYCDKKGEIYTGFVESSANKIFESTDTR